MDVEDSEDRRFLLPEDRAPEDRARRPEDRARRPLEDDEDRTGEACGGATPALACSCRNFLTSSWMAQFNVTHVL